MNAILKWKKAHPISIEHARNPFMSLHQEVDKAMRDFYDIFGPTKLGIESFESLELLPSMDIVEDDDHFCVQVEMPGLDEKDVKVSIADGILNIIGEKTSSQKNKSKKYISREISYGKYERTISLPTTIDANKAKASFKKGMLWVEIPKRTESKQSKREVKVEQAK